MISLDIAFVQIDKCVYTWTGGEGRKHTIISDSTVVVAPFETKRSITSQVLSQRGKNVVISTAVRLALAGNAVLVDGAFLNLS